MENSCRCRAYRSRTHAENTQLGASWRRERDSNWRYARSARGDAVAILNKQEAALRTALSPRPGRSHCWEWTSAGIQKTPFEKPF